MRSKPVAALLIDLDVAKTHSRPHVSDDNPYSEAQFKTLKYRPDFPDRFGSIEDARARRFFGCPISADPRRPLPAHDRSVALAYRRHAVRLPTHPSIDLRDASGELW